MYSPLLARFISPDSLVPRPADPQSFNRYAYVLNNPLKYTDSSGHVPIVPLLIVGGIILLKAIDYGWTAYDAYQSAQTLADPHASAADKAAATANLALTVATEAAEPDDLLPVSLPLDDLARKGILAVGKEAGQEAVERTLNGQIHHVLSKKILDELGKHKTLKGEFDREHFVTQAADKASHWGYDKWHRAYDERVVKWLKDNPEASRNQFLKFLQELYSEPDAKKRFPQAADLLKGALEEEP